MRSSIYWSYLTTLMAILEHGSVGSKRIWNLSMSAIPNYHQKKLKLYFLWISNLRFARIALFERCARWNFTCQHGNWQVHFAQNCDDVAEFELVSCSQRNQIFFWDFGWWRPSSFPSSIPSSNSSLSSTTCALLITPTREENRLPELIIMIVDKVAMMIFYH